MVVLWKGSDSEGNMLTSHYESFMNFTVANKTGVYNDLVNVSFDEGYMNLVTSDLEIPKDILLRLDSYYEERKACLLYTSPSPRDLSTSRMPSSA